MTVETDEPSQSNLDYKSINKHIIIIINTQQFVWRHLQIRTRATNKNNKQEAPLTLRRQRGRCRNIKGKSQIFGSFTIPRLRLLFLWVWFLVGLGKPNLCTKFEVASFSHCVNIEGNPQILGSTPSLGPCLPLLLRVILSWALANSSCMPNLTSLATSVAEILYGNPKILGSSPSPSHAHFSYGCNFTMGLCKLKLCTKVEVASFSRCRNIKGEAPNFAELL